LDFILFEKISLNNNKNTFRFLQNLNQLNKIPPAAKNKNCLKIGFLFGNVDEVLNLNGCVHIERAAKQFMINILALDQILDLMNITK